MSIDYEERKNEMNLLHRQEGWSMPKIAQKFGISRERVRQIIGNSNGIRTELAKNLNFHVNPSKTRAELLEEIKNNPLPIKEIVSSKIGKNRHAVEDTYGYVKLGYTGEQAVSEKLKSLNIKHRLMPLHHPFDIEIDNGNRVDVKTTKKKFFGYYRFAIRKHIKNDCDYFIFYAIEEGLFWIVPFSELPNIEMVYIKADEKSRYSGKAAVRELDKYRDRFDLLS